MTARVLVHQSRRESSTQAQRQEVSASRTTAALREHATYNLHTERRISACHTHHSNHSHKRCSRKESTGKQGRRVLVRQSRRESSTQASKGKERERVGLQQHCARVCDTTCILNEESARATHITATTATHVVRARRAQASEDGAC